MSKGKTATLPGMGDQVIEDVRDAALAYADKRDQRMALTKLEVEAKETLLTVMHTHDLKRYHDSEAELLVEIERSQTEKIKVRIGIQTKSADVEDGIDDATPGPDDPISEKTLKPFPKAAAEDE
jgi:hypothetical protein